MKKIHLLLGIHNHQPVGNFDHVFEQAFSRAYRPLVSALQRYPFVKAGLHFSGTLLEWMEDRDPGFLDTLRELVHRRQVEILGGGFYEPIFTSLRETDVLGQIGLMNEFIRNNFKTSPRGAWLAERVWDPVLPRLIRQGGLAYTLLDSTHFLHAGLSREQIRGYYVTEREGSPLAIFPIDKTLRYSIPFEPPEKTIDYLRYLASDEQDVAVTYGDDGEKFGLWPGTYAWVYEQGWLENFFKALERNRGMIEVQTFSEYMDSHAPEGQMYLPSLSYDEMMEWALPADAVVRYEDMLKSLQDFNLKDKCGQFLSGGYWNNFLIKYPESNHMHKKMLMLSEQIDRWSRSLPEARQNGRAAAARKELYKGQCNCAYWHGLFGGVYLNYLRHSVYKHLINAEKLLDEHRRGETPWIDCRLADFRKDMSQDVLVTGRHLNAYFSLRDGGGLFELDYKPASFNLCNTLSRKREWYHRHLKMKNGHHLSESRIFPRAIRAASGDSSQNIQGPLAYDWYPRYSFLDHFLGDSTTPEAFSLSQYPEIGSFVNAPYLPGEIETAAAPPVASFVLSRNGFILKNDKQLPLRLEKKFVLCDDQMSITAEYSIQNQSSQGLDLWFGIEFNFTLLAGDAPNRYYRLPGIAEEKSPLCRQGDFSDVSTVELISEWNQFGLQVQLAPSAGLWVFPIETVSQSENGMEKSYQGTTFLAHWKSSFAPEEKRGFAVKIILFQFLGAKQPKI